jgi:hypothetical protein
VTGAPVMDVIWLRTMWLKPTSVVGLRFAAELFGAEAPPTGYHLLALPVIAYPTGSEAGVVSCEKFG